MKNMKNIKTLTITHSRDKIIFVAENGTEIIEQLLIKRKA